MNHKLILAVLATLLVLASAIPVNAKPGNVRRRLPGKRDSNGNGNGNGNTSEEKVAICHVPTGNPNNPKDLEIAASAVDDHIGNHEGDCVGTCAECYTAPTTEADTPDDLDEDTTTTGEDTPTDEDATTGEDTTTTTPDEDTTTEEPVITKNSETVPDDAPGDGASPGGRGGKSSMLLDVYTVLYVYCTSFVGWIASLTLLSSLSTLPYLTIYLSIDPHFVKWGGDKFDFHGACDLVLLDAPNFDNGKGLTVQIRTEIQSWWSYISHVAIKIGNDVLEVQGGFDNDHKAQYWVNHQPGKPIITQMMLPFTLGGHNVRYRDLTEKSFQFKVFLGDDQYIVIKTVKNFLRIEMDGIHSVKDFAKSRGIMGSFPEGNLIARDGVTRMEDNLDAFGQEWQVSMKEPMLFYQVAAPQYPQKCRMPEVQSLERRRLLSGIGQEEARELCKDADDISDCVFDVVSTGDPDMVQEYTM